MISEFENLSLGGSNVATNHADPFTHTELTSEQQKTLIDIRRRKTELLLEIQVSKSKIKNACQELLIDASSIFDRRKDVFKRSKRPLHED